MSNQSQSFNSRYWNYHLNNNYYHTVNYYYNKYHQIINYYNNNYYYAIIYHYNDYFYYEILRMLLKLLVRIFIIILKLRWNSIALRELEERKRTDEERKENLGHGTHDKITHWPREYLMFDLITPFS